MCVCVVTQSCLTLCDPMDCNPPGSSVHGILQARILECVAMPFSKGSSRLRNRTQVSCLQTDSLPSEPQQHSIYSKESYPNTLFQITISVLLPDLQSIPSSSTSFFFLNVGLRTFNIIYNLHIYYVFHLLVDYCN